MIRSSSFIQKLFKNKLKSFGKNSTGKQGNWDFLHIWIRFESGLPSWGSSFMGVYCLNFSMGFCHAKFCWESCWYFEKVVAKVCAKICEKVCAKVCAKVARMKRFATQTTFAQTFAQTFTQTFAQTFVSFVRTNKFANPALWGTVLDPSAPSKVAKTIKI